MPKSKSSDSKKGQIVSANKGKASSAPSRQKPSKGVVKLYSNFLPITLEIPTPSSSSSKASNGRHTIYIRPHDSKSNTEDRGRTLFAVNLPVDIDERDMRTIFGRWGVIENIEFTGGSGGDVLEQAVIETLNDEISDETDDEDEEGEEVPEAEEETALKGVGTDATFQGDLKATVPRRQRIRRRAVLPPSIPDIIPLPSLNPRSLPYAQSGLRGAHITYLDSQPVLSAMLHRSPIILDKYNTSSSVGLEYYISLHNTLRPALTTIKEFADSSMSRFDHLSSMLLSSRAKKQGAGALVDEDGFTVVVRGGRYGRTGGRGKGVASVGVASKGFKGQKVQGKGAGELTDFYRFQQVDRKRKGTLKSFRMDGIELISELADLRSKFEQDKIKVEEMKRSKRFKPY